MNLKKLEEKRALLRGKLKAVLDKAETEERAMTADEIKEFESTEAEIRAIDATMEAAEKAKELVTEKEEKKEKETGSDTEAEELEKRAFEEYIRGEVTEERAETKLTKSANGAIVPTTIAKRIIEQVTEMCPIFKDADQYHLGGTLSLPYYDETASKIVMEYADEDTEGTSTAGKFKSIELTGYLGRAISEISKSLINNNDFDITSFVVRKMAEAISLWLEHEILIGTTKKIEGLSTLSNIVKASQEAAITADELIELQESIPDRYQANAYWIMNKKTRTAIRKLKDGQNNYLLNKDATSRWGYTLFGHDVYISDNMPEMAAGKRAIIYGDPKGIAVKLSEEINIEILRETKARKHMVEVLGFVEVDAKVQNAQMIAALDMKTAS